MEQKVERKKVMSDDDIIKMFGIEVPGKGYIIPNNGELFQILRLRDHFQGMIDREELVIPKTGDITCVEYGVDASTGLVEHVSVHYCRECHLRFECRGLLPARLCPGCGARIID